MCICVVHKSLTTRMILSGNYSSRNNYCIRRVIEWRKNKNGTKNYWSIYIYTYAYIHIKCKERKK